MNEETRRLWNKSNEAIKRYCMAEHHSRAEAEAEQDMVRAKAEFEEHLNHLCNRPTHDPADWDTPHWAGPSD